MYRAALLLTFFCSTSLFSQSTQTVDAPTLAAEASAAFASVPIQNLKLTGTAQGYAAPGTEAPSGTFRYEISASGQRTLDVEMGDRSHTEITGALGDVTACQHTDAQGTTHTIAEHNCSLPLDWILPMFGLQSQTSKLALSLVDSTDANGVTVHRLSLERPAKEGSAFALRMVKHLTHMDLNIDPTSFLIANLTFNEHPEQDASTDFAVEVRYSDFRTVNGVHIPFHIQKYLRGGLMLDLQADNATIQ